MVFTRLANIGIGLLLMASCGKDNGPPAQNPQQTEFDLKLDTIVTGLNVPWGLEWLPDGDMLITERPGKLHRYSGGQLHVVSGLPAIYAQGQGGLMDIKLHPDYDQNGWIYFAYATTEGQGQGSGGNTAIMRARLENDQLVDKERIFKALPNSTAGQHFGCRIVFDNENRLFFSVGERGNPDNAQTLENHSGKIHRINDDGSIPADNPFVDTPDAQPSIWSYGHRNPQGLAWHPLTGDLWEHEHGPKGGDEINIIQKGANYGWPEITYGINYDGTVITDDTAKPGMEQPVTYWDPSIAPCGMAFITSDKYPGWKDDLLVGSLVFQYLHHVALNGSKITDQYQLLENVGRVRDVKQGPDGHIYLSVDKGIVFKLRAETN